MGLQYIFLISVLISLQFQIGHVRSQRLKEIMYENIDGAYACFRRLNGTHQFGCTSKRSGNVGVVHIIENQTDADWLVKYGLAAPYVALVRPSMFSKSLLQSFQTSGKVNGVVIISNGTVDRPSSLSHEDTCPNRFSGLSFLYGETCGTKEYGVWNPQGTSVLLMDWNFPIFYVSELSHIENLHDCYSKHNSVAHPGDQLNRALCALELRSHMFASVNSRKCMKRNSHKTLFSQMSFCDPLGGRNVWQTLFPRSTRHSSGNVDPNAVKQTEKNGSIAVLATRMDATSMFEGLVPAAVGAVTSIATLITTAELLHRMVSPAENYDNNVLFLLLTGESYDYIGSSRLVYDMKQGIFPVKPDPMVAQPPPIRLEHLGPFIELSQLNRPLANKTLYLHKFNDSSEISHLTQILKRNGKYFNISIDGLQPSSNLPPASLQTFLAERPDIPGVVLTEHATVYTNKYYHSVFDDSASLNYKYANRSGIPDDSIQTYLTNLATTLAHSLYEHVAGKTYSGTAKANITLMDELLYCYLEQSNCSLFQSAGGGSSLGKPLSHYVGVSHAVPLLTGATLALLTGNHTDFNQTYCHNNVSIDQVYQYIWVSSQWDNPASDKVCVQTTMNFSAAVSPAFVIEGYEFSSGQYSTWTESVWPELTAKMFLKPSFQQEVMTLSLGIAVLVLSFASVFFVKVRNEILFSPGASSEEEQAPLIANQSLVFC